MKEHKLRDRVELILKAGRGGDGIIHFRHLKYIPKGGPDGGDGGSGGNIYIKVDSSLTDLRHFTNGKYLQAQDGEQGKPSGKTGRKGKDLILKVPRGTLVFESDGKLIRDLKKDGESILVAKGGKGGKGNLRFTSPKLQAPRRRELGAPGEEKKILLELKLISDIALIGPPNTGKTTLLSFLTKRNFKRALYPFTTISPNLGIIKSENLSKEIIIVDLPPVVKGSSKGKGLGIDFLKHSERAKVLVIVLDATSSALEEERMIVIEEIQNYNRELLKKPLITVVNKIDLIRDNYFKSRDKDIYEISSITGEGIDKFLGGISKWLEEKMN